MRGRASSPSATSSRPGCCSSASAPCSRSIGWSLGGFRLLSIFVFCGPARSSARSYWYARPRRARDGRRARASGRRGAGAPLDRRAARGARRRPEAAALPDRRTAMPRALAAGRGPRGSAIAVSPGLLSAAPPAELEGVLAHELAHVRHRDVAVQTLGRRARRALARAEPHRRLVLSARCSSCSGRSPPPSCTCCSRRSASSPPTARAAELCGSPHGLADALLRLEQAVGARRVRRRPGDGAALTFNPFLETGLAALFVTHPPVAERVRRLRGLDPTARKARRMRIAGGGVPRRGARRSPAKLEARGLPGCVLFDTHYVTLLHRLLVHPDRAADRVRARARRRAAGCSCRGSRSSTRRRTPSSPRSRTTTSTRANAIRWRRSSSCSDARHRRAASAPTMTATRGCLGYRGPSLGALTGAHAGADRRLRRGPDGGQERRRARAPPRELQVGEPRAHAAAALHAPRRHRDRGGDARVDRGDAGDARRDRADLPRAEPVLRRRGRRLPRADRPQRRDPARAAEQHRLPGRRRPRHRRDARPSGATTPSSSGRW